MTLDGNERKLTPGMLVIADGEKPIGLAGVMGGLNSEIVEDTVDVVFESANFDGTSIRQTALALGMRTESSGKFEKNLDPMMTVPAVNRACELVELLGAGEVLDGMIDILNYIPQPRTMELETDRINALLGTEIPEADMVDYLRRLEIPVEGTTISVPSFRPDLQIMADIAEEVGRLYGYNVIPTTTFRAQTAEGGYTGNMVKENLTGSLCRSLNYSEILSYSFVSPNIFDMIRLPEDSPLRKTLNIQNPLGEDTSVMRTVALPSMLAVLARNYNYHNANVKLYELAKVYLPVEGEVLPREPKHLVLGFYGEGDFYSLKGDMETVFEGLNAPAARFTAKTDHPSYHPGRCATITMNGVEIGVCGQVHPLVTKNYDMDTAVYAAEIDFSLLADMLLPKKTFVPLPKYQAATRDIAVVCEEAVTVAELTDCIRAAGNKLLREVKLFDIYRGKGVEEGKKSVAFSLTLRADDRTLTDTDVESVVNPILSKLEADLGAKLR